MKKIYKKLTESQIKRGVVFSSTLSNSKTETKDDTIHEVLGTSLTKLDTIRRLLDDKFFNSSPWRFNIIRR